MAQEELYIAGGEHQKGHSGQDFPVTLSVQGLSAAADPFEFFPAREDLIEFFLFRGYLLFQIGDFRRVLAVQLRICELRLQ